MAGNIVPAIATTNAVIAGLIVMEALKILAGNFNKCRTVCAQGVEGRQGREGEGKESGVWYSHCHVPPADLPAQVPQPSQTAAGDQYSVTTQPFLLRVCTQT